MARKASPKFPPKQCKICLKTENCQFRQRLINNKIYYVQECRNCESEAAKKNAKNNAEKIEKRRKVYYANNAEAIRAKARIAYKIRYEKIKDNIEFKIKRSKNERTKYRTQRREAKKQRLKKDPTFKLRHYLSTRINKIIKKNNSKKNGSCLKWLEYSFLELKNYIESLFEPWMTWENHGEYNPNTWNDNDMSTWTWNLDHIIPQSELPYSSMEDENFKKCWALNNLRPLNAKQNILEGTRKIRHKK